MYPLHLIVAVLLYILKQHNGVSEPYSGAVIITPKMRIGSDNQISSYYCLKPLSEALYCLSLMKNRSNQYGPGDYNHHLPCGFHFGATCRCIDHSPKQYL